MASLEVQQRAEKIKILKRLARYHVYVTLRLLKKYELTKEEIKEYQSFNRKFLRCLHELDEFEAKCIQYTFIDEKFYWWDGYYSNAQYYRYRNKAIDNFLERFFEK